MLVCDAFAALATALLTGFGLRAVIAADLCTFVCASVSLAVVSTAMGLAALLGGWMVGACLSR